MSRETVDNLLAQLAQTAKVGAGDAKPAEAGETAGTARRVCATPDSCSRCSRSSRNRCKCHFPISENDQNREPQDSPNAPKDNDLEFCAGTSGNLKTRGSRALPIVNTTTYNERGSIGSIIDNLTHAHARARTRPRTDGGKGKNAPEVPENATTHETTKLSAREPLHSRFPEVPENAVNAINSNDLEVPDPRFNPDCLISCSCLTCRHHDRGDCRHGLPYGVRKDDSAGPADHHYCRLFQPAQESPRQPQ